MPFHIYFRIGDYKAALDANKAAVETDEAYIAAAAPTGIYPPLLSAQRPLADGLGAMAGDGVTAIAAAEKLARIVTSEASRTIPLLQPIRAAPLFAHAQFSPAPTVLALADPAEQLPFVKAMWHYARGVAHAAAEKYCRGKRRGGGYRQASGKAISPR